MNSSAWSTTELMKFDPLHVQRAHGADAVDVDGARDPAYEPVRVRVLPAEDRLDLDDVLLEIERLEVVRHRHEVGLRRELVRRVAPVAVLERPELPALDEPLETPLEVAEVPRRRLGPARGPSARARWSPSDRPRARRRRRPSRARADGRSAPGGPARRASGASCCEWCSRSPGSWIPRASSTQRTLVSAWTPVQTPQMRSVNAQASRGSRPFRMTSRPRHIVPVETALRMTFLSSTFTSTRR